MINNKARKIKTILIMAMTADGKIAKNDHHKSYDWISQADKKYFVKEARQHRSFIVGRKTFLTFKQPMPGRHNIVCTQNADLVGKQEVFSINGENDTVVEYTNQTPDQILADLENRGFPSAVIGGGTTINNLFLNANCVDELQIVIEPYLFGQGLSICDQLDQNIQLNLKKCEKLNDDVMLLVYSIKNAKL